MEPVSILITASKALLEAAKFLSKKKGRTPEEEAALMALSDAYHSTEKFYRASSEFRSDAQNQWDLADKWQRVSILTHKYDVDLANRLGHKGRYWREVGKWNDEELKAANIGLNTIWLETSMLLSDEKKKKK